MKTRSLLQWHTYIMDLHLHSVKNKTGVRERRVSRGKRGAQLDMNLGVQWWGVRLQSLTDWSVLLTVPSHSLHVTILKTINKIFITKRGGIDYTLFFCTMYTLIL